MSKGFTLVELLGVIVILAIIATIAGIVIASTIQKTETKVTDIQKSEIEAGAKRFFIEDGIYNMDPDYEQYKVCVNLDYLIDKGYFDAKEIKEPNSQKIMNGSVIITYEANYYNYKYNSNNCVEENFDYIWE